LAFLSLHTLSGALILRLIFPEEARGALVPVTELPDIDESGDDKEPAEELVPINALKGNAGKMAAVPDQSPVFNHEAYDC
jgi:hypothetical protein